MLERDEFWGIILESEMQFFIIYVVFLLLKLNQCRFGLVGINSLVNQKKSIINLIKL